MSVDIREVGSEAIQTYAGIPIRFRVESVLRVEQIGGGLGGLCMTEQKVSEPYVKDYDAAKDEAPASWPERFDISNWGFFLGYDDTVAVGGAVVAYRTEGVHMLEGRGDLAVLWDIRVHPDRRGRGIGTELFRQVVGWARARRCTQLKIETQNINVAACRFYARQGCHLGGIDCHAYHEAELAQEVRLLWYLDL
jgi:GNAT superfamily N-acetyltransferase